MCLRVSYKKKIIFFVSLKSLKKELDLDSDPPQKASLVVVWTEGFPVVLCSDHPLLGLRTQLLLQVAHLRLQGGWTQTQHQSQN